MLPRQVEGDVGQHDAVFEQESAFEQQRPLIMQNILPPAGR
jgi:hypothetical protein